MKRLNLDSRSYHVQHRDGSKHPGNQETVEYSYEAFN